MMCTGPLSFDRANQQVEGMMRQHAGFARFRKVQGYRGLTQLAVHIEADLIRRRNLLHTELTTALNV